MTATTAVDRVAVRDGGGYPTVDERRAALLELGEAVSVERRHSLRPISKVLPLIVPTLAAASVANVMAEFDYLVESLLERSRFVADPDEWLVKNDQPKSDACYESADEATQAAVDDALDRLMGARS